MAINALLMTEEIFHLTKLNFRLMPHQATHLICLKIIRSLRNPILIAGLAKEWGSRTSLMTKICKINHIIEMTHMRNTRGIVLGVEEMNKSYLRNNRSEVKAMLQPILQMEKIPIWSSMIWSENCLRGWIMYAKQVVTLMSTKWAVRWEDRMISSETNQRF
jgi:hypothetical protein